MTGFTINSVIEKIKLIYADALIEKGATRFSKRFHDAFSVLVTNLQYVADNHSQESLITETALWAALADVKEIIENNYTPKSYGYRVFNSVADVIEEAIIC